MKVLLNMTLTVTLNKKKMNKSHSDSLKFTMGELC